MKTTDLIPLILYQLVDSDKYGYEIVKEIEDASSGIITIKQPTLYSLLKKLEQGKFISSYWQDSEIGGKRHYYKLTDNGKAQLDTYPAYESIIKEICGNSANFESKEDTKVSVSENHVVEPVNINISNIEQDKSPITTTNDNEALIDKDDFSNDEENSVSYDLSVEDEVSIKPIKIDLTSPITPTISEPKIEVEEQPINLPANEEIQPTSQPLINIFD
ncbi:MAG: helix-turn-helix transcriptional regulator, partial [Clostridia bacterium]|nr:helix-turn-helix transcriptional regulator [Clostridia bacterium]